MSFLIQEVPKPINPNPPGRPTSYHSFFVLHAAAYGHVRSHV